MKIKVSYSVLDQSEIKDGPFVFIRDGSVIRNLEAKW